MALGVIIVVKTVPPWLCRPHFTDRLATGRGLEAPSGTEPSQPPNGPASDANMVRTKRVPPAPRMGLGPPAVHSALSSDTGYLFSVLQPPVQALHVPPPAGSSLPFLELTGTVCLRAALPHGPPRCL